MSYSTRFTPNGNYLSGFKGYDGAGHPTGIVMSIPTSETGLGGVYTTTFGWTTTGLQTFVTPVTAGGLPAEIVRTGYTPLGHPTSTTGYNDYVDSTAYTPFAEVRQLRLGIPGSQAEITYDRDAQTRRITNVNLSGHTAIPQLDDTTYAYDPAGNVTRAVDVEGGSGAPTQTQCYRYDALDRLAEAWTATDKCAGAPSTVPGSANIGGANPYWTTWTFDLGGLRESQTQHALPGQTGGDTTTTYGYGRLDGTQPDTLTSTTTTGPVGSTSTAYTYDGSGNATNRDVPGGAQVLTWDAENRLTGYTTPAGSGGYVYDADGNQLIRRDPGSTTLYLPGEELTRTASGTVTGTRYYTHGGTSVALRVGGANPSYLLGDQHGTTQLSVDSITNAVTRRSFDPYGNPLGSTTGGAWPDTHGFLNKPVNATTGLSDVGARKYDPLTGTFISPDPVLDVSDPPSINGYTYANNNPITMTDPTGLTPCSMLPVEDRHGCVGSGSQDKPSGGSGGQAGGAPERGGPADIAAMEDPTSHDPRYRGAPATVVIKHFTPRFGSGVFRIAAFISRPSAFLDYGDNRDFDPDFDPEEARVTVYVDLTHGVAIFRVPATRPRPRLGGCPRRPARLAVPSTRPPACRRPRRPERATGAGPRPTGPAPAARRCPAWSRSARRSAGSARVPGRQPTAASSPRPSTGRCAAR